MNCLITGGSGFVGRALAQHLAAMGDKTTILDRSQGGVDITDREATCAEIERRRPDVIYHLAAQAHVPTAWADPVNTFRCNVEGTLNVLDAAHDADVQRVILASSADVYGSVDHDVLPISESTHPKPNNPYAASKLAAEAVAQQSFYGRGLDVVTLRAFNQFGPGQRSDFVCAAFAQQIARAERLGTSQIEVGRLDVRRDFCDVRDVVRAFRLAALHGHAGATYNVCSGVDRAIEEIAVGLAELGSAKVQFVQSPELVRPVDTPVVRGDASALHADTGWKPQIPFKSSLKDVLDDARDRIDQ